MTDRPEPGAYRPNVAARRPGGPPEVAPRFRVLIHRKGLDTWESLPAKVGMQNAQRLWDHLAMRPDQPPLIGSVTPMKGRHNTGLSDGTSRVYHYEVSGAGRVDYRYNAKYRGGAKGDEHPVVWIISVDLDSH